MKSSEVVASWCWEDPDATALERWITLAKDMMLGRIWFTAGDVSTRASEMRFCVAERG